MTLVAPLVAGGQACVAVTAVNTTGGAANLWGWIDFDGNGAFSAGEALTNGAGGTGGNFCRWRGDGRQRLQRLEHLLLPGAGGHDLQRRPGTRTCASG